MLDDLRHFGESRRQRANPHARRSASSCRVVIEGFVISAYCAQTALWKYLKLYEANRCLG